MSQCPENLVKQINIVSLNTKSTLDAVGTKPDDVVIARIYMISLTPKRLEEVIPLFLGTFEGGSPLCNWVLV
ncbi:hypothetical protein [Candidatus Ruthia endofausta]|uniref:hypothetical protein n=1 Tax=Candidatus Ruthia endofausta TaxID=2738852 RepID=UPI001FEBACC3|nr:hypothetical protein [Candidatus Ruthia endofausta]